MLKIGKKILIGTLSLGLLLAGSGIYNVSTASAAGGPGGQGGGQGGFMPWMMMGGPGGMGGPGQFNNGNHFGQMQNNQTQFNQQPNNQMQQGQPGQPGQSGMNQVGGNIISQVADILDVDEQDILDALKDGQTLAEIAETNGVSEEDLISDLVTAQTESIDAAVTAGTISQDQADNFLENLEERLEQMVSGTSNQQQPGGQFGQRGMGQAGGDIISQVVDIIEDADEDVDVDAQDIRDALQNGQTLAEIAEDYGVAEEDLVDQLVELQTEAIDKAVDAGNISQDQADNLLENLEERLEQMVNNSFSQAVSSLAAPTDLDAEAVDSDEIDLTWDSVSGADSYYVYRADSYSGDYEKIDEVTDNSYEDTGLDEGTTYYYKVKAVNEDGVSAYSTIVHATTDDE